MRLRIRYGVTKLIMWGFRGKVLYPYILFRDEREDVEDWLFKHEFYHIIQIRREGWFKFHMKYLYYLVRYGYENNPYEVAAHEIQNNKLTAEERELKNG